MNVNKHIILTQVFYIIVIMIAVSCNKSISCYLLYNRLCPSSKFIHVLEFFYFSLGHFTDGLNVHIMASLLSGFTTSVFSLPIDIAKTRIQNMKTIDGKPEYKNMGVRIFYFSHIN